MIGRGRDLSAPRDRMELTVKAHDRVRLDLYLREALLWKSRRRIQSLIRDGHITVNGRPAKPSQGVRGGDRVLVRLSMGTGMPEDYTRLEVAVIYEDRWLLAVDKPPGLLVHPVGRHVYDTLINYLHHRYPPGAERALGRRGAEVDQSVSPRLCHRIDKDTTGIVVVAKERWVHRRIGGQFEGRDVRKEYLTLVEGRVPAGLEEIATPLGEGKSLRQALEPPHRPARTIIDVQERFEGPAGPFTLLAARPVTGRQNQIRVHLAAAGHPVVGDARYGRAAPEGFPARYLLHARRIRFHHPRLHCPLELQSEPPGDFRELLERLRGSTP